MKTLNPKVWFYKTKIVNIIYSLQIGTITVSRTGGLFERITVSYNIIQFIHDVTIIILILQIDWQTYYSDGGLHPVALGELLVRDSGNVTFNSGQSLANITLALSPNKVITALQIIK